MKTNVAGAGEGENKTCESACSAGVPSLHPVPAVPPSSLSPAQLMVGLMMYGDGATGMSPPAPAPQQRKKVEIQTERGQEAKLKFL